MLAGAGQGHGGGGQLRRVLGAYALVDQTADFIVKQHLLVVLRPVGRADIGLQPLHAAVVQHLVKLLGAARVHLETGIGLVGGHGGRQLRLIALGQQVPGVHEHQKLQVLVPLFLALFRGQGHQALPRLLPAAAQGREPRLPLLLKLRGAGGGERLQGRPGDDPAPLIAPEGQARLDADADQQSQQRHQAQREPESIVCFLFGLHKQLRFRRSKFQDVPKGSSGRSGSGSRRPSAPPPPYSGRRRHGRWRCPGRRAERWSPR